MTNDSDNEQEADVPHFRILVVADFAAVDAHRTGVRKDPEPLTVDRSSFGAVMAELCPALALDIADPLDAKGPPLRVDVSFDELRAFRPDALVDTVAPLRALGEARRLIEEAPRAKRETPELRAHLARILPRASWVDVLLSAGASSASAGAGVPLQAVSAPARSDGATESIDSILDLVDVAPSAPPPQTPTAEERGRPPADPVSALVSAVARSARPPAPVSSPAVRTASSNAASAIAALLGGILEHAETRRLERLWRSLRLVVEQADPKSGVEVFVISVPEADRAGTLDALVEADTGGFDMVVLGEELSASAADLDAAKHAASIGEAIHAPVVVSGTPALLGAKDLAALGRSTRKLSAVDEPRAVATRAAASDESMRWLFVAINGPLVRAPWTPESSRLRGIPFSQDPKDARTWIPSLPAFGLAALSAKSMAKTGWPTPVVAPAVMLENLVVHEVEDGGVTAAIPVESFVSDDAAREIAQAGIVAFGSIPNRDVAYVRHAPCMYRPSGAVAKAAEGSLADALLVGSLVRALRELGDLIPEGTPPEKIGKVAEVVIRDLMSNAAPPGPEVEAHAKAGRLQLHVRPHRFGGATLEEISLEVPLFAD